MPAIALLLLATAGCGTGAAPDGDREPIDGDVETEIDPEPEPPLFTARDGAIRTADGHALYLRGINYTNTAKYLPGHLETLSYADIDLMKASGITSVRHLTFWDGVMPDGPGLIDEAYVAAFAAQAARFTTRGMYVVADMHQDLWGRPFTTHGAPLWACPEQIAAGYVPTEPWWANYARPQIKGCFDRFWESVELQDRFAEAWQAVAAALCPDEKIVGFDLINEPYPGSGLGDLAWDNEVLLPFYARIIDRIEAVCPGRLYFLEPSLALYSGLADTLLVPAVREGRVVFSPHYYPQSVHEVGTGWQGTAADIEATFDELYGARMAEGVPVWIGEFGGLVDNPGFDRYLKEIHGVLLTRFMPYAYWDYGLGGEFSPFAADRTLRPAFEPVWLTPVFVELPEVPFNVVPDFEGRGLQFSVECTVGRRLSVQGPPGTFCTAVPETVLPTSWPVDGTVATVVCTGDGRATVDCRQRD